MYNNSNPSSAILENLYYSPNQGIGIVEQFSRLKLKSHRFCCPTVYLPSQLHA